MMKQRRFSLLMFLNSMMLPFLLTACFPVYDPPAYKALKNKAIHFSKSYCIMQQAPLRPWEYNGLVIDTVPCRENRSIDLSEYVLGTVTPQNTYKITKATLLYDAYTLELTILNGPFAGKTIRERVPYEVRNVGKVP